jgi:hypothetical protein
MAGKNCWRTLSPGTLENSVIGPALPINKIRFSLLSVGDPPLHNTFLVNHSFVRFHRFFSISPSRLEKN